MFIPLEEWDKYSKEAYIKKALESGWDTVRFQPHVANGRGTYDQAFKHQLIGDALLAEGRMLERQVNDPFFDLFRQLAGMGLGNGRFSKRENPETGHE